MPKYNCKLFKNTTFFFVTSLIKKRVLCTIVLDIFINNNIIKICTPNFYLKRVEIKVKCNLQNIFIYKFNCLINDF